MQIVGMDIHRSFAQVAILEDGTIIRQLRVELVQIGLSPSPRHSASRMRWSSR